MLEKVSLNNACNLCAWLIVKLLLNIFQNRPDSSVSCVKKPDIASKAFRCKRNFTEALTRDNYV